MPNMCIPSDDRSFGPTVPPGCRGGFDFTLLFEQLIFILLPAVVFVLAAVARLLYLAKTDGKTRRNSLRTVKVLASTVFIGWQVAILHATASAAVGIYTRASIPVAAVNVAVALLLLALSWAEDDRSVQPSTLLSTYLLVTILLDLPLVRTLWMLPRHGDGLAGYFSVSVIIKTSLLVLEEQQKRKHLNLEYSDLPPDSTSGIINRSFLWWLNRLIWRGLRPPPLLVQDLDHLDAELTSVALEDRLQYEWQRRRRPERRFELVWALCRTLRWPLLKTVLPRLCLVASSFTQPFIVSSTLALLLQHDDQNTVTKVYALVATTVLAYVARAVASVHYYQTLYRALVMSRGALVTLIYNRALLTQDGIEDDAAAVTLMSSDSDRIASSLRLVNNIWSESLQVVLGTCLLAYQLGWACVVPLLIVASKFRNLPLPPSPCLLAAWLVGYLF